MCSDVFSTFRYVGGSQINTQSQFFFELGSIPSLSSGSSTFVQLLSTFLISNKVTAHVTTLMDLSYSISLALVDHL